MIARERFWEIIRTYNAQIWPVQLVMYLVALLLVIWLFVKPSKLLSLFLEVYFAIAFAFTGIAFYVVLAKGMAGDSYGNYFLGLLFLVVSALFIVDVFRHGIFFGAPAVGLRKYGTPILIICTLCYPLIGILIGHSVRESIMPGTFPCPTVALCLLVLTTALPNIRKVMNIILLFCAIPFTLPFQVMRYGAYEDVILFITGVYSLIYLARYWRLMRKQEGSGSVSR